VVAIVPSISLPIDIRTVESIVSTAGMPTLRGIGRGSGRRPARW
jgi:hypothetical protein